MKNFNYKIALSYAEQIAAALYWCKRDTVCVNENDQEVDWLNRKPTDQWKSHWKILAFYPYTTVTFVDRDKPTSEFNFSVGDFNDRETRGLAQLLYDVWFGYVDKKYHKSDNKTALKLQNRLTGQIVYMGWYDNKLTVTELPPRTESYSNVTEINEA